MKLALVYDRVNKWGGAERVLLALHDIWPGAPLFTAVYDKDHSSWADIFEVHPSFLQHVPLARRHHELYPWLTPMAFESFNFDGFDVVLSVTSAEAKDIITKPGTIHICYCLTPTRYLWSGREEYEKERIMGRVLRSMGNTLRSWDLVAAQRPDRYIAISEHVAKRIKKYYHRDADRVIYPPVDIKKFSVISGQSSVKNEDNFFLCVSRLVPYKRVDIVIDAFNKLGFPLKIIGKGSAAKGLKKRAHRNIEFVGGNLTDGELAAYYQECTAFVSAADEDFGIVSLEAQACGKPVVCYRQSGMAETVLEGKTGELFDAQNTVALAHTIEKFKGSRYDSGLCRKNAEKYSVERFQREFRETVESLYKHL